MASIPHLYVCTRVKKINSSILSAPKPDVLVLVDTEDDSSVIINLLKKEPILCQVIHLSSIAGLDQYYKSHDDSSDQIVYLVISVSFAKKLSKLMKKHKKFYTVPTVPYTLYSYEDFTHCDEDSHNFNEPEQLGKALRNYLNSFLTLEDVELSSQSVSNQTPRFAWFQFMFILLSRLQRSDIDMRKK